MARLFSFLLLLVVAMSTAPAAMAGSLLPEIPQATGDPHPEGSDFWLRNHMDMMRHDRNLALREGDRDIEASIGECFTCHAVKDEAGAYVTVEDERHFCRVCHDYAAVKVDCFMCHRSTPPEDDPNLVMSKPEDENSIDAYLARVTTETSE